MKNILQFVPYLFGITSVFLIISRLDTSDVVLLLRFNGAVIWIALVSAVIWFGYASMVRKLVQINSPIKVLIGTLFFLVLAFADSFWNYRLYAFTPPDAMTIPWIPGVITIILYACFYVQVDTLIRKSKQTEIVNQEGIGHT